MAAPYLLEFDHVSKSYNDVPALEDVSFGVAAGAIHVLLGEDGAGKTSLIRIAGGAHPAGTYTGEVRFAGQPIAFHSPGDAIKAGIGVVLRRPAVFDQLSIAENVMLARWQRGGSHLINPRTTRDDAQKLLLRWEIDLNAAVPARGMPPLEARLVMIARALSCEPRLVAMDEPLWGIAEARDVSKILHVIRRLAQEGITCLYLARRLNEALQIGDRVTILRDGTVAGAWDRMAFDEPAMAQAMTSRRPGDFKRYDDEEGHTSGVFGTFERWFRGR